VIASVGDLVVFIAIVAFVGVVAIVVGMLVIAPRLTRLADRAANPDEEPGDRTDD
jgi:hypothetical protein